MLWLWCRPAAVALIRPLAWELPNDAGAGLKSKKKKKKRLSQTLGGQVLWKFLELGAPKRQRLENSLHLSSTPPPQVYEVVRPLVRLLDTQRDGLQNYEALLGLTNLSGRSDKLR